MADWSQAFLAQLAKSPNVAGAARAAGVTRDAAYKRRRVDEEFAAAWDDAIEAGTDELVGEAYRRAFQGSEKPVFYRGDECGRVREYSDTLAIFLLKSHRRGVYGEKVDQNHAGGLTVRVEYADAHGDPDPPAAPPGPAVDPGLDEPV